MVSANALINYTDRLRQSYARQRDDAGDQRKGPDGTRTDSPYTESRKKGANWTHDHWEKVKTDDFMWNALKWVEPDP
jgi:hypothetical protein